jgi:hypothetical protein
MKYIVEVASCGMIRIQSFMKFGTGNIKVLPQQFERLQCWYYRWKGFMKHIVEIVSCGIIHIPSFMKFGTGVQAILRFCISNLRVHNVGITDVCCYGGIHIETHTAR